MKPAPFRFAAPACLSEALELTREYGDRCKVLAGGQSLGPLLNLRLSTPEVLIDLGRIAELADPPCAGHRRVSVGAMTTQYTVEVSPLVAQQIPLLAAAMPYVAHRTIRNRGTIGGSIAHADPSAEIPAVAVAAAAEFTVRSASSSRAIPAEQFFTGYFSTVLEPDEIVTSVSFPMRAERQGGSWAEFAPRRGDFGIVGVAAMLRLDGSASRIVDCRLVYSGIADRPWYAPEVTADCIGQAPEVELFAHVAEQAARACSPVDDAAGSADYRRNLVHHLSTKALLGAAASIGGEGKP